LLVRFPLAGLIASIVPLVAFFAPPLEFFLSCFDPEANITPPSTSAQGPVFPWPPCRRLGQLVGDFLLSEDMPPPKTHINPTPLGLFTPFRVLLPIFSFFGVLIPFSWAWLATKTPFSMVHPKTPSKFFSPVSRSSPLTVTTMELYFPPFWPTFLRRRSPPLPVFFKFYFPKIPLPFFPVFSPSLFLFALPPVFFFFYHPLRLPILKLADDSQCLLFHPPS